jgi:hypothetical protein
LRLVKSEKADGKITSSLFRELKGMRRIEKSPLHPFTSSSPSSPEWFRAIELREI